MPKRRGQPKKDTKRVFCNLPTEDYAVIAAFLRGAGLESGNGLRWGKLLSAIAALIKEGKIKKSDLG